MSETIWPTQIRLSADKRTLHLAFDDGTEAAVSAELLRVESPSAEVQGHNPAEKVLVAGKRNVAITGIEPVGNYAVRLIFSDGHASGFYTWPVLHFFATQGATIMADYEAEMAHRGWRRDP